MSEGKEIITLPSNCYLMTSAILGNDNTKGPVCFSDFEVKVWRLDGAAKRYHISISQMEPACPPLLPGWLDSHRCSQVRISCTLTGKWDLPSWVTPMDDRWLLCCLFLSEMVYDGSGSSYNFQDSQGSPNIVIQAAATAWKGETVLLARLSAIHTKRLLTHAGVGFGWHSFLWVVYVPVTNPSCKRSQ